MYNGYDAIIFDIDGVLIDVINSYNQTIAKTIEYILHNHFNISLADFPIEQLISKFRHTGGFNNDIDTAYSIILTIVYCKLIEINETNEIYDFFIELLDKLDDKGIISVEKELEKYGNIENVKIKLGYPKEDNIISTIFNEIFYGPELFKMQFKKESKYYFDEPLIKNDKLIVLESTIKYLFEKFNGNLILISGRSKISAYFTLNNILDYFIKDACIFLEDEKREYSKPNPYAIYKVFNYLNLKSAVYVGDSVEDLLMVKKFKETRDEKIIFCGICGKNMHSSESLKKLFEIKGADFMVETVNDIPNILNNIKK